jgi:uncharacterized protein YqeY
MVTLSDKLSHDLKQAMKQRDQLKISVIQMIRSQLQYTQIQRGADFSSQDEILVLQQEAKKRREAIDIYQKANVAEKVERQEAELAIIETYLPQALTEQELKDIIDKTIAEVGATSPKDIGKVMQPLMAEVRGRADGRVVQQLVRAKLGS